MRTKFSSVVLCLFLLFTVIFVTPVFGVSEGEWITKYTVEDSTGQLLMKVDFETGTNNTYSPILAGAELTVTFTVNIFASGAGNLQLSTSMQHSSLHSTYWQLTTLNYSLGSWNPNSQSFSFDWAKGIFEMVCYGKIPATAVSTKPVQFTLVKLSSAGGDVLDQIKPLVVNADVGNYQNLLQSKEDKLQSLKDSGVSAGYIELYENVIEQAKAEAAQGYVDNAIALLNALSVSSEPSSAVMESLFLPIIIVLIVLVAVAAFLFMRARGKIKYVLLVLEDQIKDLEGLTLRASKIDRTIGSNLDSIKDRLKSLVGM